MGLGLATVVLDVALLTTAMAGKVGVVARLAIRSDLASTSECLELGFLLCANGELLVKLQGDLLSQCEGGDIMGSDSEFVVDAPREAALVLF